MRLTLVAIYLAAAVVSALAATTILRRRQERAGWWLALAIFAAGYWALGDAIELFARTPGGKRLVSQFQYFGVVCATPCFFQAAAALARFNVRRRVWVRTAVWLVPALTLPIAWTSQWHTLLWREISIPDPVTNLGVYQYGPWFWVFAGHAYLVLAAATFLLIAATRQVTRPFRAPLLAVTAAVLLPWLGNIAYILKLGPLPGLNWLAISTLAAAVILARSATRQGLLDLLPNARAALVNTMQDGVLVTDDDDRVVFANPAARALLGPLLRSSRVPAPLLAADAAFGLGRATRSHAEVLLEIPDVPGAGPRWLEVSRDPVQDRWNEIAGSLLMIRDITHRKSLEQQREQLIAELETALGRVRTLEGILPICCGCKKIRDDAESWVRLDDYVASHADIQFSHGVCPDCVARLYPEPV